MRILPDAWAAAFVFCAVFASPFAGQAQGVEPQVLPLSTPIIAAPSPTGINPTLPPKPLDPVLADILAKDMDDLATMLIGRWDNELQTFFEPELGIALAARHTRLHIIVRPLEADTSGQVRFYVEYKSGGEAGTIVRQRLWTLAVDPQFSALRLASFAPKDGKSLEGAWRDPARLGAIKMADFIPVAGCDLILRRRADGFSGETRPGACKVTTSDTAQSVLTVSERHDISATAWDVRDIGVNEQGARVFGSVDQAPTRLRRATPFVCWVGARANTQGSGAQGSGQNVTATDLIIHDQGGYATARLEGATPNSVSVRLRNVDWPIGQNRPSLTLYLMTGGDPNAKAFAWSEPDSKRIALDVGGPQVSCTRDERALWR
jgi:hypothetical protein